MKIYETTLNGSFLLEPRIFSDERGAFWESWNRQVFSHLGINVDFVQDNHSISLQGTIRGLHFQYPRPQGKLVWVVEGEVFDVAVDLRRSSSTYGRWQGFYLNCENRHRLWLPNGFAHGFYVLSRRAQFCYKCTDYYYPPGEKTLAWNDPSVAIEWPLVSASPLIVSQKDAAGHSLAECSKWFA